MITMKMWPADYRTQAEKDLDTELRWKANVARNEAACRARGLVIGEDPTFTPDWMLAPLPAILRRQAA